MSESLANGRYEILRRLATGGMGEVLLAEYRGDVEVSPGLLVVKRVLSAGPSDPPAEGALKMLREEGRLGLRLMHGNLVETFRVDESDAKNPLLVIELLAGRSMAQVLGQAKKRKENVPVDVALAILRGSCCGLHFAHTLSDRDGRALGLVHRDVSPANIFVTFDGRVKVIDFGVAKSEDSEIKTATGILKGKLGYMSPEQSLGAAKLSAQADVWSLGVFFWEMLVAERLFASPNPTATLLQISTKEIPRPSTLRKDIPPAVEAICMRMLARDMPQRFVSCADVARAIDALPASSGLSRGGGVGSVDVGAFLAGRFPEEAETGAQDAARCAKKVRRAPIPSGLVDGGTWDTTTIDDDEPATAVLSAESRAALLRAVLAEQPQQEPSAAVTFDGEDDENVATVRVSAAVVEEARRAAGLKPPLSQTGPTAKARPPTQIGRVGDDEDLIATAAVPDAALAQMREAPRRPQPPPDVAQTTRNPPAAATLSDTQKSPLASSSLPGAAETLKSPAFGGSQTQPLPSSPAPSMGPLSQQVMAPQSSSPAIQGQQGSPWPPTPPVQPPSTSPSSGTRRPLAPEPRPPEPGRAPSRSGLKVSPPSSLPPAPLQQQPRPQAVTSPSTPSTPVARPTSWLAVALSTFGALVLVMGVGFSFAIARPAPRSLTVYADPAGYDIVVGDAAQVPPGAAARVVDPQNAALQRSGEAIARAVPAAELRQRLIDAGVWGRATLPSTTRTTLAALLPLLIAVLGLLALAFALPAFFVSEGRNRLLVRAALLAVVVVFAAVVVERGALSWPGRAAFRQQPKLEWR